MLRIVDWTYVIVNIGCDVRKLVRLGVRYGFFLESGYLIITSSFGAFVETTRFSCLRFFRYWLETVLSFLFLR